MFLLFSLTPKGALTSKPYAFKIRPWELSSIETIDLIDHFHNEIYIQYKNSTITRILPKKTKKTNSFISDSSRFSFDFIYFNRTVSPKLNLKHISYKFLRGLELKNLIVVDNTCDLNQLKFFKFLNSTTNLSFIRRQNNVVNPLSSFVWSFTQNFKFLEQFTKVCFICSTALNIENLLLNIKIRLKFNKKRINIFQFGFYSNSNFSTTFLSLKAKTFLNILKSKSLIHLQSVLTLKYNVFIFSESFIRRFKNFNSLLSILKKKNNTSIFYFLSKQTGFETNQSSCIKILSSRLLNRIKRHSLLNIEDSVQAIDLFNSKLNYFNVNYGFSSYNTFLTGKAKGVIPINNNLESSGVYLNIEQTIKKKQEFAIGSKNSTIHTLFNFFFSFINKIVIFKFINIKNSSYKNINPFTFIANDVILNSSTLENKTKYKILLNEYYNNCLNYISYPDKTLFEDRYRLSLNTKNSLTMLDCSRTERKQISNF